MIHFDTKYGMFLFCGQFKGLTLIRATLKKNLHRTPWFMIFPGKYGKRPDCFTTDKMRL